MAITFKWISSTVFEVCFAAPLHLRGNNRNNLEIQNTYQLVPIRTPLPHRICCSPSWAVKALLQIVHLFGNSIYNFQLLQKDSWLPAWPVWGVTLRSVAPPYADFPLQPQLGNQALLNKYRFFIHFTACTKSKCVILSSMMHWYHP